MAGSSQATISGSLSSSSIPLSSPSVTCLARLTRPFSDFPVKAGRCRTDREGVTIPASSGETEAARLEALLGYRILDTPPEQAFDDLVELAAAVC